MYSYRIIKFVLLVLFDIVHNCDADENKQNVQQCMDSNPKKIAANSQMNQTNGRFFYTPKEDHNSKNANISNIELKNKIDKYKKIFPVITNYEFNEIQDFDALKFIAFNDYIIIFFHLIILKECSYDQFPEKIEKFIREMFLQEESVAQTNIYKFIAENNDKLYEQNLNFYAYNEFAIDYCRKEDNFYLNTKDFYYNYMMKNYENIINNRTLINFYCICHYNLQIEKLINVELYKEIPLIYFSVDKLEDKNYNDIFLEALKQGKMVDNKLGLFILPIFNNGCDSEDKAEQIFEAHKKIENVLQKQRTNMSNNKNQKDIQIVAIQMGDDNALFAESNYNILKQREIYSLLESNAWLYDGFYSYYELQEYIYMDHFCNPSSFTYQTKITDAVFFENLKFDKLNRRSNASTKTTKVCICSNIYIKKEENNIYSPNSNFILSLLSYTISKIALETFEINTNLIGFDEYFNIVNDSDENIKSKLDEEDDETDDEEDGERVDEVDCEIDQEKNDEMSNEVEGKIDVESWDKNDCYDIMRMCLIIYRQITHNFNKLGIQNVENPYSIYDLVRNVLFSILLNIESKKLAISFVNDFFDKIVKLNLFNKKFIEVMNKANLTETGNHFDNRPQQSDLIDDNQIFGIGENIELIDVQNKQIKVTTTEEISANIECSVNRGILAILLMNSIKVIVTSVSSYLTKMEYVFYLAKICHQLSIRNTKNNENNIFYKNQIEYYSQNYSSNIFQKIIEETLENMNCIAVEPIYFIYNFYIVYIDPNNIDYLETEKSFLKDILRYILKFEEFFIRKRKNDCQVYVFNIVFSLSHNVSEYINTEFNSDYIKSVIKYYLFILDLIRDLQNVDSYSFPKWFIVKHDNMNLDKNIKTIHDETLGSHPLIN
ncbi:hypothetical protein COBT_002085 [Conglomerata obtusa]